MIDYSSRRIHPILLGNNEIFEKEAQQFEQEQCFFIMEVLHVSTSTALYWPSTTKYQTVPPLFWLELKYTCPPNIFSFSFPVFLLLCKITISPFKYFPPSSFSAMDLFSFSKYSSVIHPLVDLRWAQLYVSPVSLLSGCWNIDNHHK